ncbi:MAG: phosphatase PAP2 family protein [Alphaproteobacteria bacterium]|nr:MAG: phosphatase PAP2 family protein [Alphaproteobacteria bacterium]
MLAPLALLAGLLAVFFKLADDILEGEAFKFDEAILLAFRSSNPDDPIGPPWFEGLMLDLTALGGYAVLTLFCTIVVGYLLIRGLRTSAALVIISGLGGAALNNLLKWGFDRPRPDVVAHLTEVSTLSFPSGHAMLSAIIYLTLGALLAKSQKSRRLKVYILSVAIMLTMIVGSTRVYLGVHWPTDILAGWCLGGAWAMLCLFLVRRISRSAPPASGPVSHI